MLSFQHARKISGVPRALSVTSRDGEGSAACIAGASPNNTVASKVAKAVKPIAQPSSGTPSAMRGSPAGASLTSHASPAAATSSPPNPPAVASTKLSVSNWRVICQRPAPNAARSANSRARKDARASSRLAMFAQPISSTKPTAPSRTSSVLRESPTRISR